MTYIDFFNFSYDKIYSFVFFSIILFLVLYTATKNFTNGVIYDPFHLVYTFTYSTSYSVVIMLYIYGYISNYHFSIVLIFGLLFPTTIYFFNKCNLQLGQRYLYKIFLIHDSRLLINMIFAIFVLLSTLLLYQKGFSIFTETNRFEDNRGLGPIVKFWSLTVFFFIGFLSIKVFESKGIKKYKWLIFLIFFSVFSAMIEGSKSAIMFYIMVGSLAIFSFTGGYKIKFKFLIIGFSIALIGVFIVLFFNFKQTFSADYSFLKIFEAVFSRFVDRILSNGDCYYMGLPYDVIEKVQVNNPLITFFSPVISNSLTNKLAGYDVGMYDLGKQFISRLYPHMITAGGPTDHFDLFAYKYFGVLGGAFFIFFLCIYLYVIRSMLNLAKGSVYMSCLTVVLWVISLKTILKPGLLLGEFITCFVFFILVKFIVMLFRTTNRSA